MRMSDVQTTQTSEPKRDTGLIARRTIAFIIAFVLGFGIVLVLEPVILKVPPTTASFPLAFLPEVPLWIVAGVSLGFFFLIWVDYFMGTGILPD
jgi:hypothetical protein